VRRRDQLPAVGATTTDDLASLLDVARALGADRIAGEIEALRERLGERRFFVACVGQFKRGKSSVLNALVGRDVLPVGVLPVTAAVTVVRHGEDDVRARVRFASGEERDVAPETIGAYVSEKENPENEKGVVAVEVFVPCELLRPGMCLVDTPGLGSVFVGNTEATRDFVPQIDAALVVLGADPPLSGAELELIEQTASQIDRLIVVLNKADRLTDEERAQGREFAEDVLRRRLGHDVGPILEISAAERRGGGVTRDWTKLEARLRELAAAGDAVVAEAEARGAARFAAGLARRIDEQRDALARPREESAERIDRLRRGIADAERTLSELDYLFAAVEDRLARSFDESRVRFLREELPQAAAALDARVAAADDKHLADQAMEAAQRTAREAVERWRSGMAPVAETLYAEAVARFVEIADDFLKRVADPSDPALAALPGSFAPSVGFRTKARFYFTEMLTIAGPKLGTRLASFGRERRVAAAKRDARAYLERLLETNAARVANDFVDQVRESRRRVQAELRDHLRAVVASAEDALERAEKRRALGEPEVRKETSRLDALAARLGG
jgi:GTP-binding protein EngB required for normal cell division